MLTDLRSMNRVIQTMGPLQHGVPLLPKAWPMTAIVLKDCFFTIPLQEQDNEKFAFTVPTYTNAQYIKNIYFLINILKFFYREC